MPRVGHSSIIEPTSSTKEKGTLVLNRRLFMARNLDDVFQRDLRCSTFLRAFLVFGLLTANFVYTHKVCRRLIPIGLFGIRSVFQTPFYLNFGPIGVLGIGAWYACAGYVTYQSAKFTTHKFYRHIIQQ